VAQTVSSSCGSSNFDSRSLKLNAEVGIGLLDRDVARQLRSAFQIDLRHSRELQLADWRKRPAVAHLCDWVAYQMHDQL
jgi:cardiolipin synthase